MKSGGRLWLIVCLGLLMVQWASAQGSSNKHNVDLDDNEFAEFEDGDDEAFDGEAAEETVEAEVTDTKADTADDEDAVVEDEVDEFAHFQDEDEFEYGSDTPPSQKGKEKEPGLKITNVPMHLRAHWDSYHLEMLLLAGLVVYCTNFVIGRTKNQRLASAWFAANKETLENHFALIGDDGIAQEAVSQNELHKESESTYNLWCSGRAGCQGMLVEMKLLKRQDLISTISGMMKPKSDQIVFTVKMNAQDMDNFVMAAGTKKSITRLAKEMNDLSIYCKEKKPGEPFDLPAGNLVCSELREATDSVLDKTVTRLFGQGLVEYIHISDQFTGPKPTDDQPLMPAPSQKVLIFCFNIGKNGKTTPEDVESPRGLQLVLYLTDKIRKLKLSREMKSKSDKNRSKVLEMYQKLTHATRQEQAQAKREEKRRQETEKMMAEEDPDKQRRLEDQQYKRDLKRRQPKMKMMKTK